MERCLVKGMYVMFEYFFAYKGYDWSVKRYFVACNESDGLCDIVANAEEFNVLMANMPHFVKYRYEVRYEYEL